MEVIDWREDVEGFIFAMLDAGHSKEVAAEAAETTVEVVNALLERQDTQGRRRFNGYH